MMSPMPNVFRPLLTGSTMQRDDLAPSQLRPGGLFQAVNADGTLTGAKGGLITKVGRSTVHYEWRTLRGMKKGRATFAELVGGAVLQDDNLHLIKSEPPRRRR